MQYIHLNNNSFILHTSKGLVNLNRNSFNFNKIKKMVENGSKEEDISPLLVTPNLPEGIFKAYHFPYKEKHIYVVNTDYNGEDKVETKGWWLGDSISNDMNDKLSEEFFVGVYSSLKDILFDFPEYAI